MKKIMILGASILQLPAIQKAKEMGIRLIAVDMNPEAIGFKESGIIKEVISTIDTEKILEIARKHKIDGIMTLASDMPMRSVAVVAKEMGLIGITEQTALNATNKAVMRRCLKNHNVPVPEFYKVSTVEEYLKAVQILREKGFKCIVKPADNSGSRGIDLLEDYSETSIRKAYEYSRQYSRGGDVVVEEYMEGPEVSVETLSVNGECHVIQITDKLTTGAPYFVEMGHNEPSMLPDDVKKAIAEVASSAVKAIGIEDGPSHTEIKVTKEGPKIVELGARLGGDNITTHLVPLSTGVNMVECCIQIALGETPDLTPKFAKGAAIRYLKSDVGEIQKITGIDVAENMPGVKQVSIVHGVGDKAVEIKSSVDRVGFVITQSVDADSAVRIAEQAVELIEVSVGNME